MKSRIMTVICQFCGKSWTTNRRRIVSDIRINGCPTCNGEYIGEVIEIYTLRPYQEEAIESVREHYRRMALFAPTGAGKTVIASQVI